MALVAYFAYELITTRKISHIVKVLPGLGILVLLNIAFIVGVNVTQNVILSRTIEVDEVASVQIQQSFSDVRFSESVFSHEDILLRDARFSDPRLIEILLTSLEFNQRIARGEIDVSRPGPYVWRFADRMSVTFELQSGRQIIRQFQILEQDFHALNEILADQSEYVAAFTSLPAYPDEIHLWGIPEDVVWEIYAVFREEVRTANFMDWRAMVGWRFGWYTVGEPMQSYATFWVRGFVGMEPFSSHYPLTRFTPRALDLFLYHVNSESFADAEQSLQVAMERDPSYFFLLQGFGEAHEVHFHIDNHWHNDDLLSLMLEAVLAQGRSPVDLSRPHFGMTFHVWYSEDLNFDGMFYFNIEEDLLEIALAATNNEMIRWG